MFADFNGDGKPDVAVVGELNSYLSIFQNLSTPGNLSLGPRVDFGTGWNASGRACGAPDGDGRPAVAFCNTYDSTITIYQNITPFGFPTPAAPPVIASFAPSSGTNGTIVTI